MKFMKYALLATVSLLSAGSFAMDPYEAELNLKYAAVEVAQAVVEQTAPVAQAVGEAASNLGEQLLNNVERYLDVSAASNAWEASKIAAKDAWAPAKKYGLKIVNDLGGACYDAGIWCWHRTPKVLGHMLGEVSEITEALKKTPVITTCLAIGATYGALYSIWKLILPTSVKTSVKETIHRVITREERSNN